MCWAFPLKLYECFKIIFLQFLLKTEETISIHNIIQNYDCSIIKHSRLLKSFAFIDYYFNPFYASNFSIILDNTFTQFEMELFTIQCIYIILNLKNLFYPGIYRNYKNNYKILIAWASTDLSRIVSKISSIKLWEIIFLNLINNCLRICFFFIREIGIKNNRQIMTDI